MKENIENSGFGNSINQKYNRFINKDGTHNVVHIGQKLSEKYSLYSKLINLTWWKFIALILIFYISINFIFAFIYYFFCVPDLIGLLPGTPLAVFEEVYFFSAQTLTTVGYGRISPVGFFTNIIAASEALLGILTLALNTGLLYGRFVKPKAHVKFSNVALIAPFNGATAFMFRLVPIKNASLSNVFIRATASMLISENGKHINKFYNMPLQIDRLDTFATTWTIVHPIQSDSPFFNMNPDEMIASDLEILVFMQAYDEDFSNTVVKRTSYNFNEILFGAKFKPAFYEDPQGHGTIVNHQKLDDYEICDI